METQLLVRQAKQGNQGALVELIMAKKQDYYKMAYVYLNNREDALDAIEDMIVAIYENIRSLKKAEAFYNWSKTILINCCKSQLRKRKKLVPWETIEEETGAEDFQRKEQQLLLERHLSRLSGKQQEVLRLRYYLDLDYQTIAELMKIPIGTVKSRIYTGLKLLKENLGGEGLD